MSRDECRAGRRAVGPGAPIPPGVRRRAARASTSRVASRCSIGRRRDPARAVQPAARRSSRVAVRLADRLPGAVPPAPVRTRRRAVRRLEVPDHARRTGAVEPHPVTEDRRMTHKSERGSAPHRSRSAAAQVESRRAAPALERGARRDEPRRTAARAGRDRRALRTVAAPAPSRAARAHRPLADFAARRRPDAPLHRRRPRVRRDGEPAHRPQRSCSARSRPRSAGPASYDPAALPAGVRATIAYSWGPNNTWFRRSIATLISRDPRRCVGPASIGGQLVVLGRRVERAAPHRGTRPARRGRSCSDGCSGHTWVGSRM